LGSRFGGSAQQFGATLPSWSHCAPSSAAVQLADARRVFFGLGALGFSWLVVLRAALRTSWPMVDPKASPSKQAMTRFRTNTTIIHCETAGVEFR
jgi:hypothetical protein